MKAPLLFSLPIALFCAVLAPVGTVTLTGGESPPAGCEHLSGDDASAAKVDDFVRGLPERAAQDQAGIDRRLYQRFCLRRINEGGMEPVSVNSDVKSRPPAIYWDSASSQYMSLSYWDWQNRNFEFPSVWSGGTSYKNGGRDGFAISYDKGVYMRSYRMSYWGHSTDSSCGYPTTTTYTATTASQYGVGFSAQDYVKRTACTGSYLTDSNFAHGQIVNFFLDNVSGCRSIYGFSKFDHTWSSTDLTGIGIGPLSISFSNSSTSNWQSTSQPGTAATIC